MSNFNLYEHCFVELEKYSYADLAHTIDNYLFERGLCIREKDKLAFKFTGVFIYRNQFIIVFPKGYQIPKEDRILKQHIRTLINVLTRYSQENRLEPLEEELLNGFGGQYENVKDIFWLIDDFVEHGLIDIQQSSYILNGGSNISWARTIKSVTPIISNQRPVYLDLVTKKNNVDYNNLITKIHYYVINNCLNLYGWLFDYELNSISDTEDLPCDKDLALHLLDIEIQKTFADREITLLNTLKRFIVGNNEGSQSSIFTYATPYFHWVWEKICYSLFMGQLKKDPLLKLPKPYWEVNDKRAYTEQIPDILFESEHTLYILDAKYYSINYAPFKLPGWGDLVKQFFYAYTLREKIHKDKDIKNIFIFPGQSDDDIEYLGHASLEGETSLGKINGFTLDVYRAMEHYVSYEEGNFKKKLLGLKI